MSTSKSELRKRISILTGTNEFRLRPVVIPLRSRRVDIKWLSAFIDQPADRFTAGTDFWLTVTDSTLSPLRGEDSEFATLIPKDGDPHLRVQRTKDASAGVHLDLHVVSVPDACREAQALGATMLPGQPSDAGYTIMSSPAGMTFCFVPHHGESQPATPVTDPAPHLVDQISIDIPAAFYNDEVTFWSALTGWEAKVGRLDEFAYLVRPPGSPLRVLLQRLGEETGTARAHLDLACGDNRAAITEAHNQLGAETVGVWEYWTTLRDPTGQLYCLTARDPDTGSLT